MFLGLLAPHCLPKDLAFTSAFDFVFLSSFFFLNLCVLPEEN